MKPELSALVEEARTALQGAANEDAVDQVRVAFLGKKGKLSQLLKGVAQLPAAEKPAAGKLVNEAKGELEDLLARAQAAAKLRRDQAALQERLDVTAPGRRHVRGHVHPIRETTDTILRIFGQLGYRAVTGPEIEHEFYNFEALNIPRDHPARDMQDTFYLTDDVVLRTHTSPLQIRTMLEVKKPPVKVVCPGAVYRSDSDATHSPMFHQVEGLFVDEEVSMADLKGTLLAFARKLFGPEVRIRLRPSFFPFTEPSCEVDISCVTCGATGRSDVEGGPCRVCKGTTWLEVAGAGLVHPNVFKAVGYDTEKVTGFAFGFGVERLAMLRYRIPDLRLFFENDVRFLRQF
ncbi:MAG: phenylalanine--tRNA ligase subunit alpha [Deltaproteobacteria bacterium]|nr:phenylalanine--tRNA ligase subunit alpha [Deltaproteobacteria bacterium]